MFPDEPSLSLPHEGVKFTVANQGSPSDRYAWAWANGRVDLAVDIELDCGPDQRFIIPLVNALRPIAMMAAAVSGPGYSKVYGKTRSRIPRRFDWFIAVSMNFTHPSTLTVEWDDVAFPGRRAPVPVREHSAQLGDTPPRSCATGRRAARPGNCSQCS